MGESQPPAVAPDAGSTGSTRWNFNHVAALVLVLLAVALLVAIPYQIAEPERLFGRALSALSPAFYPRLVFGALLVIALAYLAISGRLHELNLFGEIDGHAWLNIGVTLACVVAYAFALPVLGFVPAGIALMLVLTVLYGNRNHYLTVAVSVLAPLLIYYGATRLLLVSLPESRLF
ncbi:MAG: tripartite tricarboxylate transporter TctB family protein [Gammaproteobacteria bacterium]|nr:tripartite tricarboxylate transporter TctB family protein [Gammaproteobacteria bacterium]